VDGIYSYLHVYGVASMPPRHIADVPLFKDSGEQPKPGWISCSLDGKYVYPDGGADGDSHTRPVKAGHR